MAIIEQTFPSHRAHWNDVDATFEVADLHLAGLRWPIGPQRVLPVHEVNTSLDEALAEEALVAHALPPVRAKQYSPLEQLGRILLQDRAVREDDDAGSLALNPVVDVLRGHEDHPVIELDDRVQRRVRVKDEDVAGGRGHGRSKQRAYLNVAFV